MHLTHRLLLWSSFPLLLSANACARFLKYGWVAEELQCLVVHDAGNCVMLMNVKAIDMQGDGKSTVLKKSLGEGVPVEVARRGTAETSRIC